MGSNKSTELDMIQNACGSSADNLKGIFNRECSVPNKKEFVYTGLSGAKFRFKI